MATNFIQSVQLLPEFLQTSKNTKFLASTIDQLIQKPDLERLDGYIGSTNTPTYTTSDVYISEISDLRSHYQLNPALILQDSFNNVKQAVAIDDLVNEINLYNGNTTDLDRLFRSDVYSYDPKIDWDKFVNYHNYYWLVTGPTTIQLNNVVDVVANIIGQTTYTNNGIILSNGMKISFDETVDPFFQNKEFFVEGVGTYIVLIDYSFLSGQEKVDTENQISFDVTPFDEYPFDGLVNLPTNPEYITINRASSDLNPWTRNNRWVHRDVIDTAAAASNQVPVYPAHLNAKRPIIEFEAGLQLYNFGSIGIPNVDFIDNSITDAFATISGSTSTVVIDGVALTPGSAQGNRVIFLADSNPAVAGAIFQIKYVTIAGQLRLTLTEIDKQDVYGFDQTYQTGGPTAAAGHVTAVNKGNNKGTSWWFNGSTWVYAQQYTTNNQAPLFDLFDENGYSYADKNYYSSNFKGNKIFGYGVGSGASDAVLGFPLKFRNNLDLVATYLFENYFMNGSITIIEGQNTKTISTEITYLRSFGTTFSNVWTRGATYKIPQITSNGSIYYDLPLGLTNNPLNGSIESFTLSDLTNHFNTMIVNSQEAIYGIRDISKINYTPYGTRLISNINPLPYAQLFIGTKENSVIDALTKAADQYNQFKMGFLKKIAEINIQTDPILAVDTALLEINANKTSSSAYYLSDMVPYGTDCISKTWKVTNSNNTVYPISSIYNPSQLTLRSILVYVNGVQLVYGQDYVFVPNDAYVQFLIALNIEDVIVINDYTNTEGNYVPPTPTKLGLYPKFTPKIYVDDTYLSPTQVIQGHDGSITVAYGDYRDQVILEFEKRIYNNIKSFYRSNLLDINSSSPGAFRSVFNLNDYSITDINAIIQQDFIKWANYYGINYSNNTTFDLQNSFTWNYTGGYNTEYNTNLFGSWRAVYKYFFDTDRPHTNPWEMLGFSEEPAWWKSEYGTAPYTSANTYMWADLQDGVIRQGDLAGINPYYSRPNLLELVPVDNLGNLISPMDLFLHNNVTSLTNGQSWKFGDHSPAETAWRRSSYWPFVVQKLLALTRPATYASLMYDPININKNIAGQLTYGPNYEFLKLPTMPVHGENDTPTSGYSVYISEIGQQRTINYNQELQNDLTNLDIKLFYKVGGFVNNKELQVVIDAVDPTSSSPGSVLQPEDYSLILNISNPIKSTAISGIIVQKNNGKLLIKGYDTLNPYFNVYSCIRNPDTPTITVGGISEPFLVWEPSSTGGDSGLTTDQTTTANSAIYGIFYQKGQIVSYNNQFYVVKISHRSGVVFDNSYFQQISSLPIVGGSTVQGTNGYDKSTTLQIPYGTEFNNIQQVYDIIIGYGAWLEDQGFSFAEYNSNLQTALNWDYTSREFLYWTTQNWADQSVIALSPFANQLNFQLPNSVVDNIFDSFYEYSLLQATGELFPREQLSVSRNNGLCTIQTLNPVNGIYFARLNSVQKEHAMVFNNFTLFNDTVYDIETGFRQERMKLIGFRTANWNGDYFSPGFVYDQAIITNWKQFTDYKAGDVVYYSSNYYSAINNINGSATFIFSQWVLLGSKPVARLLPNFDYKISQFEDFYSLNIDNFDSSIQQAAQNLIGYTPRPYLNNIFSDPTAQYKFYQGFIREKGTQNAVTKLARASLNTLNSRIDYKEEWAFRVGYYGSYSSHNEIETFLKEGSFVNNPQIISFVDSIPTPASDLISFVLPNNLKITPRNYQPGSTFVTTSTSDIFQLDVAGYVRFDDINLTSFNQMDILSLTSTNIIKKGTTIWLANTDNKDWDVLRYNVSPANLVSMTVDPVVNDQFNFITNINHGLSAGQTISIVEFDPTVDGIYQVNSVIGINQFTIINTSTISVSDVKPSSPGLIFTFDSTRYKTFDNLPSDDKLIKLNRNSKVWVDNTGFGNWAVYQKIKNYNNNRITQTISPTSQQLGWSISKKRKSNIFLVGAPGYKDFRNSGNVYVYAEDGNYVPVKFNYGINYNSAETYYTLGLATGFGQSVVYDDSYSTSSYGLMFVGAPLTSNVKWTNSGTINTATTVDIPSSNIQEGLVKISSINPRVINEATQLVLASPTPSSYEQFGHSLYEAGFPDGRLLLVGAPQTNKSGLGNVYSYWLSTATTDIFNNISYIGQITTASITTLGSLWGNTISGSDNAEYIAIGAPGYYTGTGLVSVFQGTGTNYFQTIYSPFDKNGSFGQSISFNSSGTYLFISAPDIKAGRAYGKVAVYNNESGIYTLTQIISNPISGVGMNFGQAIGVNADATELVITAVGTNVYIEVTFDVYTQKLADSKLLFNSLYVNDSNSDTFAESTTFDLGSTNFFDKITYSGAAYVYNRKNHLFKLAEELAPIDTNTGTNFGYSIAVNDNSIYIGAPAYKNKTYPDTAISSITQYYKINNNANSWNLLRTQPNVVQVDTIQKVTLFDTKNDDVLEYLDVIDPLKGKVSGIADQELKYKTSFDPAIYSIGNDLTVNNLDTNWQTSHVGELWWDLSTAKYTWYEQGELEYRRNNWGRLFPGSSIDIYEWVETTLLPSQWASQADTVAGIAAGISGQPKYSDNSVLSVRQVYNNINGQFTNYYYYWVKNSIIVPNTANRRISCNEVIQIISDPRAYGLKYVDILSSNSVAVANVGNLLINDDIDLNISYDIINNSIPKHTEWLLLQENNENSVPNTLLQKKLFDSLLGHDSLGNPVPDPSLSQRQAYGIEIRPRQSMFKDRISALRNVIEFSNSVLINQRIVGSYSFENLNRQDPIPNISTNEYDQIVEDNDALSLIDYSGFVTAVFTCTLTTSTGQIASISIVNPGAGYLVTPTVSVKNDKSGCEITVQLDLNGSVVGTTIVNAGERFVTPPTLIVRPYTVIVQSDNTSNGKWSKYIYNNGQTPTWIKVHTQRYNTPLYWNYVDWISPNYNKYTDYEYTVKNIYDLKSLPELNTGTYVKISNAGLGSYAIIEKTATDALGNFNEQFDILYSQNGTIQISNNIWDIPNSNYGFDYKNTWDQTLYDQIPDLELQYILTAIRDDLFINDLKINWNLFFFTAVKYAISEQKQLDWAFKTSFINAINYSGLLGQPPVYKLLDSDNFEQYLLEVKPYHTQIRNFITNYNSLDNSNSYITDFDLPSYYDNQLGRLNSVELGNPLLSQSPWKDWADNYTYQIGSIAIANAGSGYTSAPQVVITAASGDAGSGTTAIAYISLGKVYQIVVTNPGSGYTITPSITLEGGNAVTTATAYPYLINNAVRSPTITMKFDRISRETTISNLPAMDSFVASGTSSEFVLSWVAESKKGTIKVNYDGIQILPLDFTVVYYTSYYNGYKKNYSKIVFLNYTPKANSKITVSYNKNVNLLNAYDRITNYYSPTFGMPGTGSNYAQLMTGIEYPGTIVNSVPFLFNPNDPNLIDSQFVGGSWNSTSTLSGLEAYIGINPADFVQDPVTGLYMIGGTTATLGGTILDGDGFITPYNSYAPEELLPGEINESVGINVYTKGVAGSPLVLSSSFDIFANTTATRVMSIVPPNYASVLVSFNNTIFQYNTTTNFINTNSYSINWATNEMIIPPQPNSGKLSYTIVSEGGLETGYQTGFIDKKTVVTTATTTSLRGISGGSTVNSAYVSVNGQTINVISNTTTQYGYVLSSGTVYVYNLPGGNNTITSWFFGTSYRYFNEINEQIITVGTYQRNPTYTEYVLDLTNPPGNIKPEVANALVEFNDGNGIHLLVPPHIDYYEVNSYNINQRIFAINNTKPGNSTSTFNLNNVRVYINGEELNPGFDFSVRSNPALTENPNYVTINSGLLSIGSVIAILSKPGGAGGPLNAYNAAQQNYEYDIIEDQLRLCVPPQSYIFGWDPDRTGEIRVITYTDHDDLLMRTETFYGNSTGRFQVSRPVLNLNYVWVFVNGVTLVNFVDFAVLDDRVTVQISSSYNLKPTDNIEIITFNSNDTPSSILGYRIFNDLFNRTQFNRLSRANSTYLSQPLYSTSTVINVYDARVLSPPSIENNIPGVVMISGERIEFFTIDYANNILGQLRRSTLGTGAKTVNELGTTVFDQSSIQTIPYTEKLLIQNTLTNFHNNVYTISTVSSIVQYSSEVNTFVNDGITLSTLTNAADQIMVYYGGRLLNKHGVYYQNTDLTFDPPIINYNTSTSAGLIEVPFVRDLPITNTVGDACIVLNGNSANYVASYTSNLNVLTSGQVNIPVYGQGWASAINTGNYVTLTISDGIGGFISAIPDGTTVVDFSVVGGTVNQITLSNPTTVDLPIDGGNIVVYGNMPYKEVWVYENSTASDTVNGYVYRGINYQPPEFTVDASTQKITLRLVSGVDPNIKLTVAQKQITTATTWSWNTGALSLVDSNTSQANFLKISPVDLPTDYYYGGTP